MDVLRERAGEKGGGRELLVAITLIFLAVFSYVAVTQPTYFVRTLLDTEHISSTYKMSLTRPLFLMGLARMRLGEGGGERIIDRNKIYLSLLLQ